MVLNTLSCLCCVIFPLLFVYAILEVELSLGSLPESETPRSVGQWYTCVGIALALMGGFATKAWNSRKEQVGENEGNVKKFPWTIVPYFNYKSFYYLITFDRQSSESILLALVQDELRDFRTWWKGPIEQSGSPEAEDRLGGFLGLDLDALWVDKPLCSQGFPALQLRSSCYRDGSGQYVPCSCDICTSLVNEKKPIDFGYEEIDDGDQLKVSSSSLLPIQEMKTIECNIDSSYD